MAADAQMMSHFYSPLHHMYSPLSHRYPSAGEQKYMPAGGDQKYPDQKYSGGEKYPVDQKYAMENGAVKYNGGYEGHYAPPPPVEQHEKHKVITPPPTHEDHTPSHQYEENTQRQYLTPPEPLDVKPQMPLEKIREHKDGDDKSAAGENLGNYPAESSEGGGGTPYAGYFGGGGADGLQDLGHPAYGGYSTTGGGFGLDSAISRQRNNKNKSQAGKQ